MKIYNTKINVFIFVWKRSFTIQQHCFKSLTRISPTKGGNFHPYFLSTERVKLGLRNIVTGISNIRQQNTCWSGVWWGCVGTLPRPVWIGRFDLMYQWLSLCPLFCSNHFTDATYKRNWFPELTLYLPLDVWKSENNQSIISLGFFYAYCQYSKKIFWSGLKFKKKLRSPFMTRRNKTICTVGH